MKKISILLSSLFLSIFLISFVSAELNPFADTKTYYQEPTNDMSDFIKLDFNPDYGVITLNSNFLWIDTGKVIEYSLTKNTELCIVHCEAEGKVKLYADNVLFDDVQFKTLTGLDTSIESSEYLIFNSYQDNYVDVPDT